MGIENLITELKQKEFGPQDPRTPSLASTPRDQTYLSIENQRKLLESEKAERDFIAFTAAREKAEAGKYWLDPSNLKRKLSETIGTFAQKYRIIDRTQLEEAIVVIEGTGDTLVAESGGRLKAYHQIDINNPSEGELFISSATTLLNEAQTAAIRHLSDFE